MSRRDLVYVHHMLDHAKEVVEMTRGRTRAEVDENRMLLLAVVRLMHIIAESCDRVPQEVRNEHPGVPWREIQGVRANLRYAYDIMDCDILWEIFQNDLPALIEQLDAIIGEKE